MTGLFLLLLTDVIETPHYRLEAPANVAQEYSKILEAAHAEFEKFFKSSPRRTAARRQVRFFADRVAYERAFQPDPKSGSSANGSFDAKTRIAYAHGEETPYASRVNLIRAAATQHQWITRMRNKAPAAYWWELGMPDYFAMHHWDGTTLKLGVKPFIGYPDDHPSRALEAKDVFDLFAFVDGKLPRAAACRNAPMSWALCRFLLTGNKGKEFKGYNKWARKMDGGNPALKLFQRTFGRGRKMQKKFLTWLDTQQPQLEQVTGDWSATGPAGVRAIAKKHGILRVRGNPTAVEATIVVPQKGRWLAGALVAYNNKDDYTVVLLDWGGFIRIQRWQKTRWQTIERGQGPPKGKDGNYKLQIFRKQGKTYLMVGLDGYGPWDVPGEGIGLAIDKCDVRFKAITWK